MKRLDDKTALQLGFTHYGRFFGVVPVYMNDPESIRRNPDSAMFAARGGLAAELLFDAVEFVAGLLMSATGKAVPVKPLKPIPREV